MADSRLPRTSTAVFALKNIRHHYTIHNTFCGKKVEQAKPNLMPRFMRDTEMKLSESLNT